MEPNRRRVDSLSVSSGDSNLEDDVVTLDRNDPLIEQVVSETAGSIFQTLQATFPHNVRAFDELKRDPDIAPRIQKYCSDVKSWAVRLTKDGLPVPENLRKVVVLKSSIDGAKGRARSISPGNCIRFLSNATKLIIFGFGKIASLWKRVCDPKIPAPDPQIKKSIPDPRGLLKDCYSEASGIVVPLNDQITIYSQMKTAQKFCQHGSTLSGHDISVGFVYMQAEVQKKGAVIEMEKSGMNVTEVAHPPLELLNPAKIVRLQQAALDNHRAVYFLPLVFPGPVEDHIVNVIIDFNRKQIGFFDSKGTGCDGAQFLYSLPYSLKEQLEQVGHLCFDTPEAAWDQQNGSKVNSHRFQYDCNNCGRWIARQMVFMTQTASIEDCFKQMKEDDRTETIGRFGERMGAALASPEFVEMIGDRLSLERSRLYPNETRVEAASTPL